jgi:trigger factor
MRQLDLSEIYSMQVSVESGEGLQKRLLINVPAERVNTAIDGKLKELSHSARMDGFRPGKVPMRVLKQRYGEQVKHDVYGEMIQSTFYEAASQENLLPVGPPSIEIRDFEGVDGLAYTATFDVMPEIKLADLSGIKVKKPVTEVAEADVDAMIEKLRKQRTTWNEVDREAADGDTVTIDFKGFINGEAFDGSSGEDLPLVLGSGSMIPGFEDGLLGARAGESRTLETKFPEDYRAEHLAAKDATFEVDVKQVSEAELPPVDEGFVKTLGVEDGNLEALRAEIRNNMEREAQQKIRGRIKEQVMDGMLQAHDISVPKAMVEQESAALKKQAETEMAQSGQQSSIDLPLTIFESQAERRVKLGLLVGEVISEQEIEVDQGKVDSTIAEMAATYEDPQEIIDWYKEHGEQRQSLEKVVMEDQVVDWIMEQAQVEDESLSFEDLLGNQAE